MAEETKESLDEYFYKGAFIIVMLIATLSVLQLYLSLNNLINIWLSYKYQPIFQALFSIAVLAICIYILKARLISRGK